MENLENTTNTVPQASTGAAEPAPAQTPEEAANVANVDYAEMKPAKKKAPKESAGKLALRIIISVVIIIVGIYLILFLVAKAAQYETISSMLNHMFGEVQLMWERINR